MKMPKLRFKTDDDSDFPEWESFVLNEVCNYSTSRGNGKNYVSTENMLKDFAGVNISPDKEANGIIYQLNDILLSNIRPYLKKAWLANCNGVCSSDVLVLRPTNVEPCLLYYLIANDTFINYVMMSVSGTKMPRGDKTSIMNWKLVLPCHEEQRKIANFLLAVDDIIDKQQAEIKAWEQYKKGLAQKLFDQEVRFKADDGSDFPDWECKKLSEVASMHARIGWQNLRQDEFLDSGDFMLITGTDFQDGLVNFKTCCYVDKWRYEQDQKIQVRNGTVLVTKDGTLGKVAIVKDLPKPATLNAGVFAINPLPMSALIPKYLYHWLRAPMLMNYAKAMSTGGTIKHLNQGILVNFEISVPCLEEQRKIAECLDAIDKVIALSKAELEKWRELKKGLLQQLFV